MRGGKSRKQIVEEVAAKVLGRERGNIADFLVEWNTRLETIRKPFGLASVLDLARAIREGGHEEWCVAGKPHA